MSKWLALILLLVVCGFVAVRGGKAERLVLALLISDFVATLVFFSSGPLDWRIPQYGVLTADSLTLGTLLVFAVWSNRFWPLLIAAASAMPVLTFFVRDFGHGVVSDALGLTQGIWGNLQLIILAVAAERSHRRRATVSKNATS